MAKKGICLNSIHRSAALVIALSTAPCFLLRAQAQSVTFNPPSGNGSTPGTTLGGASRIPLACTQEASVNALPLTALIPRHNPALTVAAHPAFPVYVPQTTAKSAELSVFDENGEGVYQTTVALTGRPGVVSIRLPDSEPALDIGKSYQWKFAMICNPEDRLNDIVVSGSIQRTDRKLPSLEGLAPLERISVYASNGIWYERVNSLAQLQRENPKDVTIATKWQELLRSVGLAEIASEPVNN